MYRVTAWRVNQFINWNIGLIVWCIVTVAVLLLSWRVTEPAAAGFFWITFGSFVAGMFAGACFYDVNPWSVYTAVAVNVLGVALQAYLITCHWDALCAIDNALRSVRLGIVGWIYPDHRIFGWAIWALITTLCVRHWAKQGCVVHIPSSRPGYDYGGG